MKKKDFDAEVTGDAEFAEKKKHILHPQGQPGRRQRAPPGMTRLSLQALVG